MTNARTILNLGVVLGTAVCGWVVPAHAQRASADIRLAAERDTGLRIVVSIGERRLRVLEGASETLFVARAAVGSDRSMSYAGHQWTFSTPRGARTVVAKDSAPVWVPPDWHYVEVARREHLKLAWLRGDTTLVFGNGSTLVIDRATARLTTDAGMESFAIGEHIVVGGVLFVTPIGSESRKIPGELGEYRLSLGNGVGIHGTSDSASVGRAVTHGCLRLRDSDIEWLYRRIPVGTRVYIY